ncbi:hypothetical protein [Amycolatopsis anabasis]|uniref:hypothetical protein n=1 Tax=Amycolatopsis anabasis TaxID=1840409 RepID=UPI00131C0268|nr:hypothetical protein [Amycolatopsis anabasis]
MVGFYLIQLTYIKKSRIRQESDHAWYNILQANCATREHVWRILNRRTHDLFLKIGIERKDATGNSIILPGQEKRES